ncbi:MAG: RNA polymerase sigma factor [Planctomycetota bacterium]
MAPSSGGGAAYGRRGWRCCELGHAGRSHAVGWENLGAPSPFAGGRSRPGPQPKARLPSSLARRPERGPAVCCWRPPVPLGTGAGGSAVVERQRRTRARCRQSRHMRPRGAAAEGLGSPGCRPLAASMEPTPSPEEVAGARRPHDREALQAMLVAHQPMMIACARFRAGSALKARFPIEDVVQSTYVEVLEDLARFEYRGPSQLRRWLRLQTLRKVQTLARRLARHRHALREIRSSTAAPDQAALAGAAGLFTPSRIASAREELSLVLRRLRSLRADVRQAIVLRRIEGLPYREIAARMGRSVGAVRNLVHRGLARITVQEMPAREAPTQRGSAHPASSLDLSRA